MLARLPRSSMFAIFALACGLLLGGVASAQDCENCQANGGWGHYGRHHGGGNAYGATAACRDPRTVPTDLFYNYYVGGNCGSIPAAMYPAPYPTPLLTGHTWYTYQPLLPHEYMYTHKRSYHTYYDGGSGLTRTSAHYGVRAVPYVSRGIHGMFELAR